MSKDNNDIQLILTGRPDKLLIYLNSKFSITSGSPKKDRNQNKTVSTSQRTINMFFDMVKEDNCYQNEDNKMLVNDWFEEMGCKYKKF